MVPGMLTRYRLTRLIEYSSEPFQQYFFAALFIDKVMTGLRHDIQLPSGCPRVLVLVDLMDGIIREYVIVPGMYAIERLSRVKMAEIDRAGLQLWQGRYGQEPF